MLCFDQGDLFVKGNRFSKDHVGVNFSIIVPPHQCRNSEDDLYCIGSQEFEQAYSGKRMMLLSNRKRFNQLSFDKDSPIVEESFVQWSFLPPSPTLFDYKVRLSELSREDNLFMAITDVTEKEETYFQVEFDRSQ